MNYWNRLKKIPVSATLILMLPVLVIMGIFGSFFVVPWLLCDKKKNVDSAIVSKGVSDSLDAKEILNYFFVDESFFLSISA